MLEIAGGILLAFAVLALLLLGFRYVVLAASATFCLAITAGAWLVLAWGIGRWQAAALLIALFAIWFWNANRDSAAPKTYDPDLGERRSSKRNPSL